MAFPIDKYAHDSPLAWNDLPPDPAEPMPGKDAVLQLYAPADNTMLDLGAGKTPGIRMATDKHVHLTARNVRTTISLGAPGGDGISKDDPAGLQVYSAGEKRETIDRAVVEVYKDTKCETVHSATQEKYLAAKTEIISGPHTQKLFDEHHFGVRKDAVYDFDACKRERIVGDWNVEVMGKKHETIHGDRSWLSKGKWVSVTMGAYNEVFVGEKAAANLSVSATLNVGASNAINLSAAFSTSYLKVDTCAISIANTGLKANRDQFKVDHADIKSSTHRLDLAKDAMKLTSSEASIVSAMTFIVK